MEVMVELLMVVKDNIVCWLSDIVGFDEGVMWIVILYLEGV